MATHCGYIVQVKELRKHSNADRLMIATFFGNETVVDINTKINDIGVYFPVDLQLSAEFAEVNNLVRKKDDSGNQVGGFLDPDKRNIKAIKLRGEKSDGLYLPLTCLETFGDISTLKVGDTIDVFNGHEICKKYIPKRKNKVGIPSEGNKTRKKKVPIAPLFNEHADTEQLAYNLGAFKPLDEVEITLKMHGTSQRTAYLPVLKGYKRTLWDRLRGKEGKPIYDWGYVSGTRRVVLEDYEGGYYGSNSFREKHSKFFEGKLNKGEEVFYEVVSYTDNGIPIMPTAKTPKEYIKQYGEKMEFSYGRTEGSDIYVYRMTMTNEDGFVVEYTPDFMRYRCEQMGVKTVPVFWKGTIPAHTGDKAAIRLGQDAGAWIKEKAEEFYDGPDPIGKTHIREGVVVRITNKPKFCAYKHKNFCFKVCAGIAAETFAESNVEVDNDLLAEM